MSRSRFTAVATALLLPAALAAAGCGLGPGATVGEASLTVTRDFGADSLLERDGEQIDEAATVMRVLEGEAEVETRYGGGFVQSIEGLEAEESGGDGPSDWFFFVDGVESPVGAADYRLDGDAAIWWDYRDWSAAMRVPAVVGSWPRPLLGGYEGKAHPVAVECLGAPARACATVESRLAAAGVTVAAGGEDAIRILVGPWARVGRDPAAAQIEKGPQTSGVYAEFQPGAGGLGLVALDEGGDPSRRLGPDAGLVAATRRYEAPPVWVVTGVGAAGVEAAAGLLDSADLHDRYAVATDGGTAIPLPAR